MERVELPLNDEGDAFVLLNLKSFDEVTNTVANEHVEGLAVSNAYGYVFMAAVEGELLYHYNLSCCSCFG